MAALQTTSCSKMVLKPAYALSFEAPLVLRPSSKQTPFSKLQKKLEEMTSKTIPKAETINEDNEALWCGSFPMSNSKLSFVTQETGPASCFLGSHLGRTISS